MEEVENFETGKEIKKKKSSRGSLLGLIELVKNDKLLDI